MRMCGEEKCRENSRQVSFLITGALGKSLQMSAYHLHPQN